jgi:hypothetical protein
VETINLTGRDTDTAFILRKEDNENIVPIWNAGILQDSHEKFYRKKNAVTERKKKMLCPVGHFDERGT